MYGDYLGTYPHEPREGFCVACISKKVGRMNFSYRQCSRKIKDTHEGKGYCGTHSPVAKKERDKKERAKWEKEWKRAKEHEVLEDLQERFEKALIALGSAVFAGELGCEEVYTPRLQGLQDDIFAQEAKIKGMP
jgi:hypothetical protein